MGDSSENYSGNEDEEEENELPQIPLNLAGPKEVNVDNSQVKIGNTVNVNFSVGNIVVKSELTDQLLQGCSTQLPGNDLKQIIGEIVAQTIPRYLQDKSLMAIEYNENCTHEGNQNFQKEDNKVICSESNGLVTYGKSAPIASSHEYNIQEIDDSKASCSKQAEGRSKNTMKDFRKPLTLWASPEFCDLDEKFNESSLITPRKPLILWASPEFCDLDEKFNESSLRCTKQILGTSSCLPENYNPKLNCFESELREVDESVSSGSKQAGEPHACLLNHKQLSLLSSSSLPENNLPKMMKVKIRETDDSEASCSTQIFSKSGETQACHLKSKSLSPSRLPGNNHQEINYFESKVQETDDLEASCSKQILGTSNYKQIYNQSCLLKHYSTPQLSVTSSKHGEDITESCSNQNVVNKVPSPVEHEPNANPRSTLQTVDNTSLVKSLSPFELQNLIIHTFVEEVCSHFKANIPCELSNIKTTLDIFITYIVKVFEVICKGGKLRSVEHIEMTRVTDFEKYNNGLSFNIEFSFKELIISFDNCHLHFLPILKVVFPGLYNNYEPVTKKLEIVIKECLIKTHFIIANVSNEIGRRTLNTNVYFLDNLIIKITSEDIDSNLENKIGEQYFEKYLQTHYLKILKNILTEIFNISVNYVTGVKGTNFYNMIQNVFN